MKEQEEAAKAAAKKLIAQFLELHDVCSVRIFFVMNGAGRVTCQDVGNGDIYSMQGGVREWLLIQDESARIIARREAAGVGPSDPMVDL